MKKRINKHTLEIEKSWISISTMGLLYIFLIITALLSLFGCSPDNGVNGYNSLVKQIPSMMCPNGGVSIMSGIDISRDGLLQADEVLHISDVCNGENYEHSGGISIVGTIDPCGDTEGAVDEILLKLSNGALLSSFSDDSSGKNTHFAYLTPGRYETTDGTHCHFTVTEQGFVVDERAYDYNK